MYKIANQIIDVYDDVLYTHMRKIAKVNSKIDVMDVNKRGELADHNFALSVITKQASKLNKFPIVDHDSTWLSNQYFQETNQLLPGEAALVAAYHIKKACDKYSVDPAPIVETMFKAAEELDIPSNIYVEDHKHFAQIKTASLVNEYEKFSEIAKICDNDTFAKYAFATPSDTNKGNEYFEQFYSQIPPEYRYKYAIQLQKRAGDLGFELKGKIEKFASNAYSAHVDAHLASRKDLLQIADPKFTSAIIKLGKMKDQLAPLEFAKVLLGFDKRAGLDKYYNAHLTHPFEATFGSMANPKQIVKVGSQGMSHDDFSKVITTKYAKVKEYFGYTLADNLKKEGAAAFEALPNDAKEVLAGIANGTL